MTSVGASGFAPRTGMRTDTQWREGASPSERGGAETTDHLGCTVVSEVLVN